MLLQINGIGKQKISYKQHDQLEFLTLKEYLTLAKKAISKFANNFYDSLAKKMLKDEDALSLVANAIMMADWRWDENYKNQQGTKKSKYSYRNQCALWAIQTYVSKEYKKNKKFDKVYSLDSSIDNNEDLTPNQLIKDSNSKTPVSIVIEREDEDNTKYLVNSILSLECITDRQKDYIRLYYLESQTFESIGKKYGITREAVRQGLNKALEKIRSAVNGFSL